MDMEMEKVEANRGSPIVLLNVVFALIGIGYLFPFSALTQPVDYWKFVFPSFNIEFYITCVFLYTNLITLGLVVAFAPASLSYSYRIVGGFVGQLLVLVLVPVVQYCEPTESVQTAWILGATGFAAIATAFLDSCVIALAAKYPVHAQAALQFGIGLSTLIGSLYRDITKLAFDEASVVASSALYFFTGAVTVGLCIGAYFVLLRIPKGSSEDGYQQMDHSLPAPNRWAVLRKCIKNQLTVALLFMTTLSLWPPLVTEMKSFNSPGLQQSGWWPLILLTVFSVMDIIGRCFVPYRGWLNKDNVWKPIAVRLILIPCIFLTVKRVWFTHDAWSVLFVLLLGVTNGYFGALSVIFVTDAVDEHERAVAGTFTGFFLSAGLVVGSTIGLGFSQLLHD